MKFWKKSKPVAYKTDGPHIPYSRHLTLLIKETEQALEKPTELLKQLRQALQVPVGVWEKSASKFNCSMEEFLCSEEEAPVYKAYLDLVAYLDSLGTFESEI